MALDENIVQSNSCSKMTRRAARIWKKRGGLFWKSETTVSDLDPNFHCSWIRFKRSIRNWDGVFGRNRKFKRIFRPKTGDLQTKKKRSSPKLRRIFRPKSEIQRVLPAKSRQLLYNFGTKSLRGGAVFIFWAKIGLKSSKNVRLCILFRPIAP